MGRWLLTELERASLARRARRAGSAPTEHAAAHRYGAFLLCAPLAERSCYLVVTTQAGCLGNSGLGVCVRDLLQAAGVPVAALRAVRRRQAAGTRTHPSLLPHARHP